MLTGADKCRNMSDKIEISSMLWYSFRLRADTKE